MEKCSGLQFLVLSSSKQATILIFKYEFQTTQRQEQYNVFLYFYLLLVLLFQFLALFPPGSVLREPYVMLGSNSDWLHGRQARDPLYYLSSPCFFFLNLST